MDDETISRRVQELLDRQEIIDCLQRYSRGLDRFDRELAQSAYHPDALDDHQAYIGSGHGLVEWADRFHEEVWASHQHHLTNISIELDGETAHTETYFIVTARKRDSFETFLCGGRYIDRFERRDGEWRIAARVATSEWVLEDDVAAKMIPLSFPVTRDRDDASWQRPLEVERPPRILFGPGASEEHDEEFSSTSA
jgi:hypothetical protein